jgi:hypothetical protein
MYCASNPINYTDPSGHKPQPKYKAKQYDKYRWYKIYIKKKDLKKLANKFDRGDIDSLITDAVDEQATGYARDSLLKAVGLGKVTVFLGPPLQYELVRCYVIYTYACWGRACDKISKGMNDYLKKKLKGKSQNTKLVIGLEEKHIYKGRYEYTGKMKISITK